MLRPRQFWLVTLVTFLLITCSGVLKKVVALSLCTILGFETFTCNTLLHTPARAVAATRPAPALIAQDIFGGDRTPQNPPQDDVFQGGGQGNDNPPPSGDIFQNPNDFSPPPPSQPPLDIPSQAVEPSNGRIPSIPSTVLNDYRLADENISSLVQLVETNPDFYFIDENNCFHGYSMTETDQRVPQLRISIEAISRDDGQICSSDSSNNFYVYSILSTDKKGITFGSTEGEHPISIYASDDESISLLYTDQSGEVDLDLLSSQKTDYLLLAYKSELTLKQESSSDLPPIDCDFMNRSKSDCERGKRIEEEINKIAELLEAVGLSDDVEEFRDDTLEKIRNNIGGAKKSFNAATYLIEKAVDLARGIMSFTCTIAFGDRYQNDFISDLRDRVPGFDDFFREKQEFAQKRLAEECGMEEEQPQSDRDGPPSTGKSYGDPHMITYDGYRYSFQTLGEYVLTKSVGGDFEVQTRQTQVPGRQLSLNTAAAIKVGNNRVAFYVQFFPDGVTDTSLRINGEPTYIDSGNTLELPGGGEVYHLSGNNYQVITASGESVDIQEISMAGLNFMNVGPHVYSEPPGQFIGLLGDLDGDPANDLRTRGGDVIPSRSTYGEVRQVVTSFVPIPGIIPLNRLEDAVFNQIYKDFGNSWRVDSAESLFDYAPGEGPATFADPNFPSSYRSLENLTPEQMQEAEAICLEAGVEPELLDGCVFDVAFTEEPGFAQAAANALLDEVGDRVLDEIQRRAPVPIPRLPF